MLFLFKIIVRCIYLISFCVCCFVASCFPFPFFLHGTVLSLSFVLCIYNLCIACSFATKKLAELFASSPGLYFKVTNNFLPQRAVSPQKLHYFLYILFLVSCGHILLTYFSTKFYLKADYEVYRFIDFRLLQCHTWLEPLQATTILKRS